MRDNQRGSQSYMKNRRGRKEIEVSTEEGDRGEHEERKGDSRGERQIYTVICSQSVLRSPDTQKDSQNWIGKRRGMGCFSGRLRSAALGGIFKAEPVRHDDGLAVGGS